MVYIGLKKQHKEVCVVLLNTARYSPKNNITRILKSNWGHKQRIDALMLPFQSG